MEEKRVADYFVIAGLPENPSPLEEFSQDGCIPKSTHSLLPITDITVIIRSQGEILPHGYTCLETTPYGFPADLNHGSLRSPSIYLCYRRGRDKPPLVDIGVLYEGKERVMADSEVVLNTPYGRPANVNNSGSRTFLTYRRALENAPCNQLVVTDIRVILANKGEMPPHAFCTINKNLNKGMVGSDVFLCYKKSMNRPDLLSYKPAILGRYPLEDYQNFPLPLSVPLFCLPMGATIECWPKKSQQPKPIFSTFVLTSDTAEKVYGAAVTFYEKFHENKLTTSLKTQLGYITKDEKQKKSLHACKSICILSRWPFFDTFEKFLRYLHRMSVTGPHKVPLERYISHFMLDIPFPSPQRPRILIQLSDDTVSLAQPEDTPLPLSGASFIQLLRNLGPDNCLKILLYALSEQKILFHSLRPDVLTSVAEAVVTLIFPFHWQCPYIPLCPIGLSDVLSAPLPFIVGVDSRYFDLYDPPNDVTSVDLDTNSILLAEDKRSLTVKLLPKRPARVLRNSLQSLYEKIHRLPYARLAHMSKGNSVTAPIDHDFKIKKREHQLELEIQEAFLRFMASVLKGFRTFLLPITTAPTVGTTDPSSLFDLQGFLKSRDKTYHRFFILMMKTQMFIRFIEERSFVSDKDVSLAFFDDCTEKVEQLDCTELRLLEVDESQQSDRTVFIAPPEPGGLSPCVEYTYQEFGTLKPYLFHKHPAKTLLSVVAQASPPPSSPMARRTKQEIKYAQKVAKKLSETPMMWAKCLLEYCFSLWFIHLPAYTSCSSSKAKALRIAYKVLTGMQSYRLRPSDEVCYRVLMLLCGLYSQPVLAVKVLFEMKNNGVQPNAITYGYYNKAVLESKWPSGDSSAALMWNKLRNVIIGVAQFRQGVKKKSRRSLSLCSELDYDGISRTSTEESNQEENCAISKVNADPLKVDDQSSSGGQSDGGYCSMSQDEGQKILPSVQTLSKNNCTKNCNSHCEENCATPNRIANEPKKCSAARNLKFGEVDFTESDEFRSRVGSIVRSSASSLGSLSHLYDATVDSSAGVLITSQASLLESCSCQSKTSSQIEHARKRHKSAGDPHRRCARRWKVQHCGTSCVSAGLENENHSSFNRSYSFGNDVQIIQKINDNTKLHTCKSENEINSLQLSAMHSKTIPSKKQEENGHIANAFGLSRCDEESETELDAEDYNKEPVSILPKPRSPNIPIKQSSHSQPGSFSDSRNSFDLSGDDRNSDCSSLNSADLSTNNTPREKDFLSSTLSPLKEAWLNWDLFAGNSLPKVASSLSYSLGLGSNNNNENQNWTSPNDGKRSLEGSDCVKVTRSSTFHHESNDISDHCKYLEDDMVYLNVGSNKKTLSRSSTLPVSPSPSAGIKTSGTRTPTRNITSSTSSFGLSRFTSKHSEVFLDSIKSAASSVASKISEFRQSLSASSTPTKGAFNSLPKPHEMERLLLYDDDDRFVGLTDGRRVSVDYLGGRNQTDEAFDSPVLDSSLRDANWSRKEHSNSLPHAGSVPTFSSQFFEIFESLGDSSNERTNTKGTLEISMTSCSRCYTCSSLLYDEEIMEGWSADDSNLNTQCTFCNAKVVPLLTITIRDLRIGDSIESLLTPADSSESVRSAPVNFHHTYQGSNILQTPPQQSQSYSKNSAQNSSIDSNSEAFILFEDSPDNMSLGSDLGTPYGSPWKNNNRSNQSSSSGVGSLSSQQQLNMPSTLIVPSNNEDLIKLESPVSNSSLRLVEPFSTNIIQEDTSDYNSKECKAFFRSNLNSDHTNKLEGETLHKDPTSEASLLGDMDSTPTVSKLSQSSNTPLSAHSSSGDVRHLGGNELANALEPITVPYLSPLVLRKEVETVLEHEGDSCLTKPEFVDQHPIIYWNMIWYFKRINVPSHLPGLCLQAATITKNKQVLDSRSTDSCNVVIHCLWDNIKLQEEAGYPMYTLWSQEVHRSSLVHALVTDERKASRNLMKQILSKIQANDLLSPIKMLINERRKQHSLKGRYRSIYREILFLSLVALGRENIDISLFDLWYIKAYDGLSDKQLSFMAKCDKPLSLGANFCRRYFRELELASV